MKVVLILPTYNERENILALLQGIEIAVSRLTKYQFTILIVDDNSPDGTAGEVKTYLKKHKNIQIISGKKEGLGKALLRGMTYALEKLPFDFIMQMDADLSHDPAVIPQFIKKLDEGADFVVGSRYIQGGSIPNNWGIHRKIFSITGNAVVRYGLGFSSVHDWTGGFRAYKRKYVEEIHREMNSYGGYVFQIAFLHKALARGADVREVPIQFTDRKYGRSKIAPSEYIRNVLLYVGTSRLRSMATGSFGKFAIVGTVGFTINTIVLELMVFLGLHPVFGSITGAELAIVSNFFLNNRWTFKARKIERGKRLPKFLQFNSAAFGALAIQSTTVFIGTHLTGVETYRLYYVMGVGFGLIWNYWMYSNVIWRKQTQI